MDAHDGRARRERRDPFFQGEPEGAKVSLAPAGRLRHFENQAAVSRLFHRCGESALDCVAELVDARAVKAAVCEIPEAPAEKPLCGNRSFAGEVDVYPDQRGVLDIGAGIDDGDAGSLQHCKETPGAFCAEIYDDAVESPYERIS